VADGALVAVAGAEVAGRDALLRSVAVARSWQRRGVGEALVGTLLEQARRRGLREVFLLTTTAADWFPRFGFERRARDAVPRALRASAEFNGACPDSAVPMGLSLDATASTSTAASAHDADAMRALPVAVLGAGPVGLAAAARLIERGLVPLVLEAAESVGANLLDYGHVRLFSPWRHDIDAAMAAQLAPTGWTPPPDDALPLAAEVVERVLRPYARLPLVAAALHLRTRVTSITREGLDKVKTAGREHAPFVIRALRDGQPLTFRARAVIDATGTWSSPNPLGADGLPAPGEAALRDRIRYGIPDPLGRDRARYAGRRTLVVGAGHSAANALLGLAALAKEAPGTRLAWAVRSAAAPRALGGGTADALPARGQLGIDLRRLRDEGGLEFLPGLRIAALRAAADGTIRVEGIDASSRAVHVDGIDEIVCATGQRPDLSLAGELRLALDPWLESSAALGPLIDPNLHSCGTVRPHGHRELAHPEPGFYTVGVKSYGRAPTFLMATGFEQARSVVAAIDGDPTAADRVELDLPETGVCSLGAAGIAPEAAPDRASPPVDSGCGCSATPRSARPLAAVSAKARSRCCARAARGAGRGWSARTFRIA
jgi:hypothetical protein